MAAPDNVPSKGPIALFFLANEWLWCFVALSWPIFSVWLSSKTGNWVWFSRSGAIMGIAGAVLSCRSTLRLTSEERIAIRNMSIIQRFTADEIEEQERDSRSLMMGVVFLVLGTLICAYGDLTALALKHLESSPGA